MRFAWNDVRARFVARSYHTTVCSQPCFVRNTNGVLMQNLRPESERIFSSGKEEDAGILSYFKDDDTDGGEIRPPRAHCNLIALTIGKEITINPIVTAKKANDRNSERFCNLANDLAYPASGNISVSAAEYIAFDIDSDITFEKVF